MTNIGLVNKGYQTLPETIAVSLGAIAANTALQVNATYGSGLTRPFLLKYFKCLTALEQLVDEQGPILVGLAVGTATVTEIKNAMEDNNPNPDDPSAQAVAAKRKIIFWQSLHIVDGRTDTVNMHESRLGARGKGIPIMEDNGVQVFLYNADSSALTSGASLRGHYILGGVWLND